MPRKPTYQHDFTERKLNPPLRYPSKRRGLYTPSFSEPKTFVLHKLPRLDSQDGLAAAREVVGGGENGYFYLPNIRSLVDILQHQPAIVELNWYENFNHPKKHPFLKARRQFFFIGEGLDLGKIKGSWALAACGYHKARNGHSWIRFQNCWGHDYPLVWMPLDTIKGLWGTGQMEASIPA